MNLERMEGSLRQVDLDSNSGRVRVANAGNAVSVVFDCPQSDIKRAFRRSRPSVFIGRWTKLGKRDIYVVKGISRARPVSRNGGRMSRAASYDE